MTDQEFEKIINELVHYSSERTDVEVKGPGKRDDKCFFARVSRAMMGMANRRDGGLVVIGIEDKNKKLTPIGLNEKDIATWNKDDVADRLNNYADPPVEFTVEVRIYGGKKYIVIDVKEFDDIPILCKKDYTSGKETILRNGACYVRSRHKAETAVIPSHAEMRDLLDLAAEKRLRKFVAQTRAAGINLVAPDAVSDQTLFDRQLSNL